jgi:5-methyltetrahydropteroyltriglutamate--homocysteine methyltransferase
MANTTPYRADQVGSLLRPTELKDAHEKFLAGKFPAAELRKLEDKHILDAIKYQENLGLHAITDGEFRRSSFHADFIRKVEGAGDQGQLKVQGTAGGGLDNPDPKNAGKPFAPRGFAVTAKLRHARPIEVDNFKFVKAHTSRTAKQTIPSPTMLLRGGRGSVDKTAYPDLKEYWADIAKVYQEELQQLGAAGCNYIQLDDTNYAYLCDSKLRETFKAVGDDPSEMPGRFASLINAAIAGRPAGMVVGIHLCRGNSQGRWAAEGGYEPVADSLLNELKVDGYFLEYDDNRSGDFQPLRFFPKGSHKRVVLGLISTKNPQIESKDNLKRRIDEASKFVPLENLCLSPQCGFASTFKGNPITDDVQKRKIEVVVQTATDVWGTAK